MSDTLATAMFRAMLPFVVPEGTRLILAHENLLETFGTRTEYGQRITVEWGESRPEGWYEPVFTTHAADWHDMFVMLRRQLVGSPPNIDSIDAAIGYALTDCEAKIAAALGEIDPEFEGT